MKCTSCRLFLLSDVLLAAIFQFFKMTSSAFCELHPNCAWIIASRTCIVLAFVIAGVIGNGTVLYIYRDRGNKQQQQASRIYIVTLAYYDIFSLFIVLPQTVLYEYDLMPESVYIAEGGISVVCYLFVQVAMVIDRVFAVFTPFKYLRYRDRFNMALFGVVALYVPIMTSAQLILIFAIGNENLAKLLMDISLSAVFFTSLSVISGGYPAIAIKLWRQKNKVNAVSLTSSQQKEANKPREVHIKALRLYVAVLALFVLSNVPNVFHMLTGFRFLNYFFYVNCIGNPVVYYIFNEKFRNDFNDLFKKLKRKLEALKSK